MQSAKYKVQNENSNCNYKCEYDVFLYSSPIFIIFFFFSLITVSFHSLDALQDTLGNVQIVTLFGNV